MVTAPEVSGVIAATSMRLVQQPHGLVGEGHNLGAIRAFEVGVRLARIVRRARKRRAAGDPSAGQPCDARERRAVESGNRAQDRILLRGGGSRLELSQPGAL